MSQNSSEPNKTEDSERSSRATLRGVVLMILALALVYLPGFWPGIPLLLAALAPLPLALLGLWYFLQHQRARRERAALKREKENLQQELQDWGLGCQRAAARLRNLSWLSDQSSFGKGQEQVRSRDLEHLVEALEGAYRTRQEEDDSILREAIRAYLEVLIRMPYLKRFIVNTIEKTEQATLELIQKFTDVSDAVGQSNKKAKDSLQEIRQGGQGRKGDEELIREARQILEAFEAQKGDMTRFRVGNKERFDKVSLAVEKINGMIHKIVNIAELNNIIAINSSIEASKLGQQGAGFKVLVSEIIKSNEKTQGFIQEIGGIVTDLIGHSQDLNQAWEEESQALVEKMNGNTAFTQEIINSLIASSRSSEEIISSLGQAQERVRGDLDRILQSLQFQDITRQQLENVMEFLGDIEQEALNHRRVFQSRGYDPEKPGKELVEKVKESFRHRLKVVDEKLILRD